MITLYCYGLCLLCVIFAAGGDDAGGTFQYLDNIGVRRIFALVYEDNDSTNRNCDAARSTDKRKSSLKQLVVLFLRGGHYDLTSHYAGLPPPPPPPPPYPPLSAHQQATEEEHSTGREISWYPIDPTQCACHTQQDNQMYTLRPSQHDPPQQPPVRHLNVPPAPPNAYLFPPGTWERYLRATKGDVVEAQRRLTATLNWRMQNGMDEILSMPHPHIGVLKRCYPHVYHLRGYQDEPVYYECPGKIDLDALKSAGLTLDHLLRHYALVTEFIWTCISPYQDGPGSKGITVLDMDGVRLRDFAGDVVTFVKRAASFTGQHYPERSGTIYILNAPSFFQLIWRRVVVPLVDPVTLGKVRVVDSNTTLFVTR
ncbi:hypothetical protein ACHAW5_008997 [Stephanodiscus triporus]|uniref:CRAL-TRIO domain-containing protein n=1 Tax=Stephanodiscus triporus TaxID=2934178 RepID=A0ABD3PID3_9STRA